MAIFMVKVRATINFGGVSVSTPYILSFNVDKVRGQISTFNASVKILSSSIGGFTGSNIAIYAGEGSAGNTPIFTGIIRNINIMPCHDDPAYVIVNLSGNDILSTLQGKKYTRRSRASKGTWISIQSVSRRGLKTPSFTFATGGAFFDINAGDLFDKYAVTRTRALESTPLSGLPAAPQTTTPIPVVLDVKNKETPQETK